jgi:NAD(P) transhydrogenase subunit alpha
MVKKGLEVLVESGAGAGAYISDQAFVDAGARIVDRSGAYGASVIATVAPPPDADIQRLGPSSTVISFMRPLDEPDISHRIAQRGATAFSMELVPRISRAQKMDALSAMANIGGYKAVIDAAAVLPRYFPLLTTAAGTVKPANVLVLGAGVAGLQAIATAKRLGARVSGYDIRDAVKEQVESLGATFVELELEVSGMEDQAGYAKALSDEKARRQTELLVPFLAKADVVVSTALIPGRPAPELVTEEAVKAMAEGSVIVDMAASNGGNCALTESGKTVIRHGVTIMGPLNLPATMPVHASELYGRTVMALVFEMLGADGTLHLDMENEVLAGACVCRAGDVVNERVRELLATA